MKNLITILISFLALNVLAQEKVYKDGMFIQTKESGYIIKVTGSAEFEFSAYDVTTGETFNESLPYPNGVFKFVYFLQSIRYISDIDNDNSNEYLTHVFKDTEAGTKNMTVLYESGSAIDSISGYSLSGLIHQENSIFIIGYNDEDSNKKVIWELTSDLVTGKPSLRKTNSLSTYPNPTQDIVNIEGTGDGIIDLTDSNGNVFWVEVKNGKIDITHLSPGVYLYKNQEGKTAKILKQ